MSHEQETVIESTAVVVTDEVNVPASAKTAAPVPAAASEGQQYMRLMEVALNGGADIAALEKLVELHDAHEAKQARKAFYVALANFQSDLPVICKRGEASFEHRNGGGNTSYSYAKLEDIAHAIKPLLARHGLSYRFEQFGNPQEITICCIVTHELGHRETTKMSAFPDQSGKKNVIQQQASTVSYLRRYTLTGAFGITVADEDTDASGYLPADQSPASNAAETSEAIQYYSDADFQKNFPSWEKSIRAGKNNPDRVIAMVSSKAPLTEQQQQQIKQVAA